MNTWKVSLVLLTALCVVASVQADSQKITLRDEEGVWATSVSTDSELTWNLAGKPIDWRPDAGMGQWRSAVNGYNPDPAPFLAFFFDDTYMVETAAIENLCNSDGQNFWHGAGMVNVYVSTNGGVSWNFVSMPTFRSNSQYNPSTGGTDGGYQAYDPFTFFIGQEANAVKFEFVNCGSVQFLNPLYEYDQEAGEWVLKIPREERVFVGNGADTYVGLNNVTFFGTPVPEPMTMSLLVLGGLAMLRRRDR